MTFTIVDVLYQLDRLTHRACTILFFLGIVVFPLTVSAEWLTVEMEGAKEKIYLDTDKGALYVGSDCSPLFYFTEASQQRSKSLKLVGKYYKIESLRSRSLNKSALPSRLPTGIIVNGNSVQVLSESMQGRARALGKIKASVRAGRKKASQCK